MNIYCLRAKGMENKFAAIPASSTPVGETENKHRKKGTNENFEAW